MGINSDVTSKKRNLHVFFIFAIFVLTSTSGYAKTSTERPPNIIIILTDDLGYADVEGFGNNQVSTPFLSQMSKEGLKLTSFYATPNCSPSRAALLTGCYPQRVGIPWVVGPEGPAWTEGRSNVGLHPKEETLAELLKEVGYATAAVGKWHLGHHLPHLPAQHGFDTFFGLPYSNDMWPVNNPVYAPLTLLHNNQPVDTISTLKDQARLTKRYTRYAQDFIEQHSHENPFFLYLAHSMPHVPIASTSGLSADLFSKVISDVDQSVGSIIKTVDSLGQAENTLIIFTSDNGPWLVYGNHTGSAAPLREGKHTSFEGGVRVPFIARWPGHLPAGGEVTQPVGLIDILPTLADISGFSYPSQTIDGVSFWPLLSGLSLNHEREVHYFYHTHTLE